VLAPPASPPAHATNNDATSSWFFLKGAPGLAAAFFREARRKASARRIRTGQRRARLP
jgi:hypothetical protein